MKKFVYHNCKRIGEADLVMVGVPDEKGSKATRHGAGKGPNAIRRASHQRLSFYVRGKEHIIIPERGCFDKKLFDAGNIKKEKLTKFVKDLKPHQFPVVLGGDHSITYHSIKGFDCYRKIAIVYFDAHPDIVSSRGIYYGSVVADLCKLPHVSAKKIVEIGIRSIEAEEVKNIKKRKISTFTALDVAEQGARKVFSRIKKVVGNLPLYISIDLDCLDPAFAPAVDTPAPFGLNSNDFLYLVKKFAELNLIGFDIMELSPIHDIQQQTAHLAAQTIIEIVGSEK